MPQAQLIIASSESSADQLYASKFRAPDAFVFLRAGGKCRLLLSDLEVDRGRAEAGVDEVHSFSEAERRIAGKSKKKPSYARVVATWLKEHKASAVVVPDDFPLGLAGALAAEGIRIRPSAGPLLPGRQFKSPEEVRAIEAALRIAEAGILRAWEILSAAKPRRDGTLAIRGRVLTSEALRIEMETAVVRAGGEARGDTIVAGGGQACDPHGRGSGPLRANELIILDIFPRDARTGFYGDITRTIVRGRATAAQRHLWETCLAGQKLALKKMRPGTPGLGIHEEVKALFAAKGYPTRISDGRWQGFFHGTGHGLGLEVHEFPRFGATTFAPGQVLTVEPGIYIPGLGGVRHEDVALVTKAAPRLLTSLPKPFEI